MTGHRIKTLLRIGLGLAFGISLGSIFLHSGMSPGVVSAALVGFMLVGIGLAWALVGRVIQPGLVDSPVKMRIAYLAGCLLGAILLVLAIPWTAYPKDNTIHITATGEKNPQAERSEVWLASISNDRQVFTGRLPGICASDWYLSDGKLVSTVNQPSEMVCHVRSNGPIIVKLGMHQWAGKMRLAFGQQVIEQDLYSPAGETFEISLPVVLTLAERMLQVVMIAANCVTLAGLLLAGSLWAIRRKEHERFSIGRKWRWLAAPGTFGLALAGAWLFYLLIYWPGFFTTDTLSQFKQLAGNYFNDWHPAFHTMTLWLITRAWFTPASVIIVQVVLLSALLGVGFAQIVRRGAPLWLAWLGVAFLGFSPGIAWILLNPWKDVAYSICLVALTLLFLVVAASRGRFLAKPAVWIGIGVVAALASLYRHNGAPVALASLGVLWIAYPKRWKSIAAALGVGLAFFLVVKGPLYSLAQVNAHNPDPLSTNPGIMSTSFLLIEYQKQAGVEVDPAILEKMVEVRSQPTDGESLIFLARYGADFNRAAEKMALEHPFLSLGFAMERSKYIFQVLQPPLARLGYVEPVVEANPFGFTSFELLPWVKERLTRLIFTTEKPYFDWLVWRNAFWMYALIFGSIVAWARLRDWRVLLLIAPVVFNSLPLAVLSGGQIARYILPTLIIGPWLAGFLVLIEPGYFQDK